MTDSLLSTLMLIRNLPLTVEVDGKPFAINAYTRSVLFVLASRGADGRGRCFPSLNRLRVETGVSRRQLCYVLIDLECMGLVKRTVQPKPKPTIYQLYRRGLKKLSTEL